MLQHHVFTLSPLCESNSPENSAPPKEWWDRSILISNFQGFCDWFLQSKKKNKTKSKYHLFNISVVKLMNFVSSWNQELLMQWYRLSKTAELLCRNFKEKSATWGRKKSQNIPVQIINIRGIYYWLQRGVYKALGEGDSPQPGTPCCPGAVALMRRGRAPPAPHCSLGFLAVSCCLLMIKQILGIPLFEAVVKSAKLTGLLQRNRWSLYLRHSHWAGYNFSSDSFEIFLFHSRIAD